MQYSVRGLAANGEWVWEAEKLEGQWYSTGRGFLFVRHASLKALLEFWLREIPTDEITSSWGKDVRPAQVIPNTVADLVHKELTAKLPPDISAAM